MSRINRSQRLDQFRTNYVKRQMDVGRTNQVEKVTRIKKTNNAHEEPSENYLLSFDHYNKTVQELKKEFKQFYHHEQKIKKALASIDENEGPLVHQTEQLINKYNDAIFALHHYDAIAKTTYATTIHDVFLTFKRDLNEMGIFAKDDYTLTFNPKVFIAFITSPNRNIEQLLTRFKSMVFKKYYSFLQIRAPIKEHRYETAPPVIKGLIVEEEG